MRLFRWLLIIGVIVVGAAVAMSGANRLPTHEEVALARWSDVQNQYKRRADLIPNLVETVKGYARQEQETLTRVTEARAKATAMTVDPSVLTDPTKFRSFQEAQGQLSTALGRLMVLSERYPDLKSNQNFLALQSQLEGTENRIAVARRDYIEAVRIYNTEIRTFPGRWYAAIFYPDARPMQTFAASEAEQSAPAVRFQ